LTNYFKSFSSLVDDRFLCHPVVWQGSCTTVSHWTY